MKSLYLSLMIPALAVSGAAPKLDLAAPGLDKKVADYFAVVNGIEKQMDIIQKNSAQCTPWANRLNKGVEEAKEALARNEKAIKGVHSSYHAKVAEIQKKFSADGTTIIQGGALALEKGILVPIKTEVGNARKTIAAQQEGLRDGDKKLEQNNSAIRGLLAGNKEECKAALKAYDNSYAWSKSLPKKLAAVDAAFQGQVDVAQARVDLLTAVAAK
jgi:hypothetical protein